MALLDRLKDATKPTNTIEAVQQQGQATPPDLHRASPAQAPVAPVAEARKAGNEAKAPAYATEPEAISRAYYVEDRGSERRYFDDYKKTALAIRSDDTSINSKREDLNTIRAMLTMAESRGWQEVKVNGSAEFKREAWIEAATRGITAQGYKASDIDRQEADRRRKEQGQATSQTPQKPETNEIRQATVQPSSALSPAPSSPVMATPTPQGPVQQVPSSEKPTPASSIQPESSNKQAPNAATPAQQEATPTRADHRKALREATAELSQDGRLMLAAVSEKIDREMNKMNNDGKSELKAYFATELVKKEKSEGPVVLSTDLKRAATAPEPIPQQKAPEPERQPERHMEPEEPHRTRSR
ncbi:hypothetical protein HN018_27050 (plasmid) [Lichenicola cladoniae]|uniref:Large polyvalent protein-associated domain-containing protein n=1 Tax=Lichenicola cladoniae TaxID=1484109 RepID=A0A6M8HZ23_9PROT|nr:LPD7 domain-containing protein [Lichenicola cladoniae]NPD69594.1 hypothetical protein [Acetobacteraceae bacterium]QKE93783.1 hypothetical protein HN018_27050 [Lichenicola cladoniae]